MEEQFYVYILASDKYGTLHVGMTSDLLNRVGEHKMKAGKKSALRDDIEKLVYYEIHADIKSAIRREKRLKFWERDWKVTLIEHSNPQWCDLYLEIGGDPSCEVMDPAVKQDDKAALIDG